MSRFKVQRDGRTIWDEDFNYDALLRINGDFPNDAERLKYAHAIANALNAAEIPTGRERAADR
ncbi:MAG: hypothetical protein AB7F22_30160 [Reyranella sp.]|uniref:hypothetical protein n=1 Tax=Reyranella sp. TaxID=1929291 RepID=UPI003D0C7B5A